MAIFNDKIVDFTAMVYFKNYQDYNQFQKY